MLGKLRAAASCAAFDHVLGNDLIRINRFLAAAQNRGVAGFETKARGVGGHVRTRFVDDDDDADGRGDFLQLQTVWARAFIEDFSDGIGSAATSRKPLAIPAIRLSSSFRRSSIAVERPICAPASMSLALASLMAAPFFFQRIGHGEQAGVFLRRGQFRQFARRGLGLSGQLRHLFRQSHKFESTVKWGT